MLPLLAALSLLSAEAQLTPDASRGAAATSAAPAPPQVETAAQRRARERAIARNRIECDHQNRGSNFTKMVCMTRQEWERQREEQISEFRQMQDGVIPNAQRGRGR